MATDVPGVVHIGGGHAQGGQTGQTTLENAYYLDLNDSFNTPKTDLAKMSDRALMQVTPHDITDGKSMAVASGAHIWYDEIAMSGAVPHTIESVTATSITLSAPVLTSGVHDGKRLTYVDDAGGVFALFSGLTIAGQHVCTGNTDQVCFFASGGYTPHIAQGVWVAEGRFTDYHPCAGHITSAELVGGIARRGGSTVVQSNHGVGPDATYMPDFFNKVWNTAPFFHAYKYVTTAELVGNFGDSPSDALRTNFTDKITEIEAAAAQRGNTIKWEVAIIDLAMNDLETGGVPSFVAYQEELGEMITWLRSASGLNNSDLKIILINHRADMWNITGQLSGALGAPFYRTFHENISSLYGNVGIVDMHNRRIADSGNSINPAVAERKFYAQQEYLWMGEEIVRVYQRLALGTATAQSGGFPTYMFFGDSIAVGQATESWVTLSYSTELTGETVGDLTRPSNQLMYVRATETLEIYKPGTNGNPSGHAVSQSGPEMSIMAELGKLHPEGFAMIKRGSSSSGLAATLGAFSGLTGYETGGRWHKDFGEHWPEMVNDYSAAMAYINGTLGKQADLRAIFVTLGHNDHVDTNGGNLFADNFGSFITDLHETFGTETDAGRKAHIVWRRPQTEANGVVLSGLTLVRTAIENRAASDDYFHYIDVDALERDHRDNLHMAPDSSVTEGRLYVGAVSGAWVAGF